MTDINAIKAVDLDDKGINLKAASIEEVINNLSNEFDERCFKKHELGEEKYGVGTWLGVDTVEHALDEIIDLANYARMSYIKLRMMQAQIASFQSDGKVALPNPGKEMIGKESLFKGGLPE